MINPWVACRWQIWPGRVMQFKVLGERPEKRDIVQIEEYSSAETIEELTKINALILRAEEQGQKADLAPRLTDDFIIIRATGLKQNRDEFLEAVPDNAGRGRTAHQLEVRARTRVGPWSHAVWRRHGTRMALLAEATSGTLEYSSATPRDGAAPPGKRPKSVNPERSTLRLDKPASITHPGKPDDDHLDQLELQYEPRA